MKLTNYSLLFLAVLLNACSGSVAISQAPTATAGAQASPTSENAATQPSNAALANKVVQAVRVVPDTHVMIIGEAKDLLATIQYTDGTFDSNVTFSTSDSRIVEVNGTNGRISAKAEGVASIVVAAMTDSSKRALVTVTVRKGVVQEALTRVEPAAVKLRIGETEQLTASVQLTDGTLSPNVQWESSNQNVAMVSSTGLVTAVGKGKATITARASGDALRKASSEVTVE